MITTKPVGKATSARSAQGKPASRKALDSNIDGKSGRARPDTPESPAHAADVGLITPMVSGLVIGVLHGFDAAMQAMVSFDGSAQPGPIMARSLVLLGESDIGKMLALQFERGDIGLPVVLGLLAHSARPAAEKAMFLASGDALKVSTHGEEVVLSASRKLTLLCGRASLTLDVDGNIEIRGQDVLSRAAGQNRIKGSSISLN